MVKRLITLLLIIVVAGGIYFSLVYHHEHNTGTAQPRPEEGVPAQQLEEINLTLSNEDQTVSWEVRADQVSSFDQQGLLLMQPVRIKVRDKDQGELYSLQSGSARFQSDQEKLTLTDNVRIIRDTGEIKVGRLDWQQAENLLTGRGGVSFHSPFFNLTGDRMQADLVMDRLTVYGSQDRQAYLSWKEGD